MAMSDIGKVLGKGLMVMLTTPSCPGCKQQKRTLDKAGVFGCVQTVDMYEDAGAMAWAASRGISHAPTLAWLDPHTGAEYTVSGPVNRGQLARWYRAGQLPALMDDRVTTMLAHGEGIGWE